MIRFIQSLLLILAVVIMVALVIAFAGGSIWLAVWVWRSLIAFLF